MNRMPSRPPSYREVIRDTGNSIKPVDEKIAVKA